MHCTTTDGRHQGCGSPPSFSIFGTKSSCLQDLLSSIFHQSLLTLGNSHYWKHVLCQEPARSPRQRLTLRKEAFTESSTLGKDRPSINMSSTNLACWVMAAESRQALPRASRYALDKDFFEPSFSANFLKSLLRALGQALGNSFFIQCLDLKKYFYINNICRGPEMRPSAVFAEGQAWSPR